jgi:hypothetical protein
MGAYGVSVEKEIQFRGSAERITNVYHYAITIPVPADYDNLADAVVAKDKTAHVPTVAYKRVRVWGPTEGSQEDNRMRVDKEVTGNGSRAAPGANLYPELCAVTSIYVGRSPIHNRKVFVRKYWRLIAAQSSSGVDQTTALMSSGERAFWATLMDGLKTVTSGATTYAMVTPRNVPVPVGEPAKCLTYARIRQMHQ